LGVGLASIWNLYRTRYLFSFQIEPNPFFPIYTHDKKWAIETTKSILAYSGSIHAIFEKAKI
ncbi:MAG: hypothetical protein AAGI38_05290, partial [Bacteroidota bacterium]